MQNPWLTPAAAADSPNNTPWISRRNLEELQTVVGFLNIVNLIFITLTTPRTPKLDVLPQEGSALSSGKGHSPYPRDLSRTLSTIFYQLNAYDLMKSTR